MARLIPAPSGGGPVGPFEQILVERLRVELPDSFALLPNFSLRERDGQSYEYDVVVLAPHALFVLEAKEWYGRLVGDDTEWLLNEHPRKCPMWLVEKKAKVLKSKLGALGTNVWIEALLALPDGIQNNLYGNWARNVSSVAGIVAFLRDAKNVRHARDIKASHAAIEKLLLGECGKRLHGKLNRIGTYQVVEALYADDQMTEVKAKRALLDDPNLYRVRSWRLSGYESAESRETQLNLIRRPTEAIAKVGRHPNLLQILEFSHIQDENLFFEVTEWSDYGTLHGYLKNHARDQLTLRERLEIAAGVASALEAVHSHEIVHRNVCPETILIAFDRTPRLTDFDRAYIESKKTVFASTEGRQKNLAYVAPELRNATDYDFDTCSDMFSFGVLLYELLVGEVPFPDADKTPSGILPKKPSQVREGVDPKLDALIEKLVNVSDFRSRPSATESLGVLREVLGSSSGHRNPASSTSSKNGKGQAFEVGHVVDGVFRIDARLGSGAFSTVWKVYHLDQGKTFAMKVLKADRPEDAEVILNEFNKIGSRLPQHQNIPRITWLGRTAPPASAPYILSEFVDGEPLDPYCNGTKSLPWSDIRRIGAEVLDALAALHPKPNDLAEFTQLNSRPADRLSEADRQQLEKLKTLIGAAILHRDIKPANILLELPLHRAKLIDFNISTTQAEAEGRGGTPRYWAPDRGRPAWLPNMDLFSLGVVLYELVTHRHPFRDENPESGEPYDPKAVSAPDLQLSDGLRDFLLKAVCPRGAERFQSAQEMAAALIRIDSMAAQPAEIAHSSLAEGLTLLPAERGRKNYNPFVTRLLTLYSQARHTNSGTRGLDEIARTTYVETQLDKKLAPRVADGDLRLLIVTGNAGDGKTAFLQRIESYFRDHGVTVRALASENGADWAYNGLKFETNYDGSQDEGGAKNDDVLAKFLAPFRGATLPSVATSEVRILAINEGRLLDFLGYSPHRLEFEGLRSFVLAVLNGEKEPPAGALLINLNLRAVSAGGPQSIVSRQIQAMVAPKLWASCGSCDHRERCPLKHNADTLADVASGPEVRDRIRKLFEIIHVRRRAHVTMRDLRSALSWILLRDTSCDEVAALLSRDDEASRRQIASLYYPDSFAADPDTKRNRVDDRIIRLLREADVGLVNSPQIDGRLDHDPRLAVPWMTFEARSTYGRKVVESISSSGHEASFEETLKARRFRIERWRRWTYFERRDEGWRSMLPYRSASLLDEILQPRDADAGRRACEELRNQVVDAISLSEGMRHIEVRKRFLALRVSRVKNPSVRSFRLFPIEHFTIQVPTGGSLATLIEYSPNAVDLVAAPALLGSARLRISLDLLEMLSMIRNGYRPSQQDLQGLFVNLQIFRNELQSLPFSKIVATQDDEALYEISSSVTAVGAIELLLRPYSVNSPNSGTSS